MKRISLFLGLVQFQQVKALSTQLGLSVAELIRRALDEFLERHTPS
jgi:Ribbon-helix-helix domain